MMKRPGIIFTMLTLLSITGYSREVNFMQYFQFQLPFTLTVNTSNKQTGLTASKTILVSPDSEKFTKLLIWCNKNTHNWNSSSVADTIQAQLVLKQSDLQLLYNKNRVTIMFIDYDGKKHQYSKNVKKGALDFLTDFSFATVRNKVNADIILTFKYPNNWAAESIGNSRCIGESLMPMMDGSPSNSMMWCIWVYDTLQSVDSLIMIQKNAFREEVTEQRENILLNGNNAVRVTLESNNKGKPYRQMIYFQKHATLFEVINNEIASNDFDRFYNSITITKRKKPSR